MNSFARKLVLFAGLMALLPAWAAVDVKGAKFEDTYQLANQSLALNGAGVRVKLIVDVYAAGLYLPKKDHSAAAVLSEAGPKSMKIVLLRNLTGETFADAMVAGFKKNNSEADVAKFQTKMEEIRTMMLAFGEVKKGTVLHIDHVPGAGTHVLVDGVQKGGEIVGDDFFAALLKIWLGNSPVDSDLKEALLGAQ